MGAAARPGPRPRPGPASARARRWARTLHGVPRAGTRAPGGPCPDFTSFFTFHSSFSLSASSALPMVLRVAERPRRAPPQTPLAASAPLGSAPHAQSGAPVRCAPRPPPPPQPLPGARLRSHVLSPAQTSGSWPGPFPQPGREAGGGGALGDRGRPAWERATPAAVMATRRLQSPGREPAL